MDFNKDDITRINKLVGERLRILRVQSKMNQTELGAAVGVLCPQISKFENGQNRISAGMLAALTAALGITVEMFYEGIELSPTKHQTSKLKPNTVMCTS